MSYRLITSPYNAFEPGGFGASGGAVFQTFDPTTGVLVEEITCTDPPLTCNPNIYPFAAFNTSGRVYGNGYAADGLYAVLQFANNLTFLSTNQLTPPDPEFTSGAPEVLSDHSGNLFGLWQVLNIDAVNWDSSLVQIDPDTLVQTVLWSNFQPEVAGDRPFIRNAYAMSPTGDKFYYATLSTALLQLNIATGVTTTFVTAPAGSGVTSPSHFVSVNPQGRVFISWTDPGIFDRVIVYESDGSTVVDIDFDEELLNVCSAPDPDGNGFWVLGQVIGVGVVWQLRHYSLPGGVLDTTIEVPTPAGLDPGNMQYFQLQYIVDQECELTCGGSELTITGVALDVTHLVIKASNGYPATFDVVSATSTEIIVNNLVPSLDEGEWCIAFTPGILPGSLIFTDGNEERVDRFVSPAGVDLVSPHSNPTGIGSVAQDFGGFVILDSGEPLVSALNGPSRVYDIDFNTVADVTDPFGVAGRGAGTNYSDSFYLQFQPAETLLHKIDITGTIVQTWDVGIFVDSFYVGASPDSTVAYLGHNTNPSFDAQAIISFDLVGAGGGTVLVAQDNNFLFTKPGFGSPAGQSLAVLRNGNLLVIGWNVSEDHYEVRMYNPAGTLLNTYDPPTLGEDDHLRNIIPGLTNNTFWWKYWIFDTATAFFEEIQISDGATLNSFSRIDEDFSDPFGWIVSSFCVSPIWINEWPCCVTCGSGPGTPTATSITVSGACADPTLTINGTDLTVDDLVMKGPDDNPVTFNIVSDSSTQIIIDSLSPAFTDGEYCVGFEPDTYPFCFDLECTTPTVTSVAANCSEDPITLNITGTNMVSADLVIQGPDDLPVTYGVIYDTPSLIKVVITPVFTSGEYCFGFEPATYPFCFDLLCVPTITSVEANCTEDPISINITGTAMVSADLVIKGPDDNPVTFGVIFDTVTLIKVGALSPPFNNGEYCFGFAPGDYTFCATLFCFATLSGIYFLDPTATDDTLYIAFDPVATTNVKIP